MKTGKKQLTGTLLALCAALLVLCIVLAIGWSKTAKADAVLPEVRNNGTAVQWKYRDETDWRDLVALTELTGAAKSPQTGGNSGVVTVSLLSGGAFICLVSCRKKRTHTV